MKGIAILANEHLEAEKQGNNTKRLLSNKIGAARFVLLPCEICVVPFGHGKIAAD